MVEQWFPAPVGIWLSHLGKALTGDTLTWGRQGARVAPVNILVVDDDDMARAALGEMLRGSGFAVHDCANGEEAWALLEHGLRPALCCSDVRMPQLDGIGLLRRLRAHPVWSELPLVLMSGAADTATLSAATAAGASGYLLKPYLALQARSTVRAVLNESRARRAEHFLVTARRTGMDLETLQQRLQALHKAAEALVTDSDTPAAIDRLRDEVRELGLWRCVVLLESLQAAEHAHAALMRREVVCLVQDQIAALQNLDPAP